ncbi:Ribokinase-like protein [Microdochium trichocladiopsis]|uniref:Ribokinase n=1 Tax=Microdochium trichocladiopsis TaxID=1682393 RepID=A0A9P8XVL8_9PEZI|nr:Ribokinase-like protein [Microdochium trichocladiopsis]KAH7018156.1 Ribokinase-like protein [Microdochium trichocladiopsis]
MATRKPIITTIGSLNVDVVVYTPRVPEGGETLTASSFHTGLGGKGANQAVACAKLSRSRDSLADGTADVRMVGAVGSDVYGTSMLSGLRDVGVDTSGVAVREGAKTGVATIIVEETSGQNRILLSPEANHTVLPEHFATALPEPTPDLVVMQLEIPLPTVLQILDTARRQGVQVLLNPAPAVKIPAEYYPGITHLVVNETEAALLTGCAESELDTPEGLARVAGIFHGYGTRNVLVTLGGRGVYYSSSGNKSGLVPAQKVKVVDTTAAGDTFVGAYSLAVVGGDFDIEKAVKVANSAAAITVQRRGAQESIPWLNELSN